MFLKSLKPNVIILKLLFLSDYLLDFKTSAFEILRLVILSTFEYAIHPKNWVMINVFLFIYENIPCLNFSIYKRYSSCGYISYLSYEHLIVQNAFKYTLLPDSNNCQVIVVITFAVLFRLFFVCGCPNTIGCR